MKIVAGIIICAFVFIGCQKDKFTTSPQIEIKAVNSNVIPQGFPLNVRLEFRDKEGDVSDSIFIIRERINRRSPIVRPPLPFKIPTFPSKQSGEIEVNLDYSLQLTLGISPIKIPGIEKNEPDTMRYKFVVRDLKQNVSDTAVLNDIIVIR